MFLRKMCAPQYLEIKFSETEVKVRITQINTNNCFRINEYLLHFFQTQEFLNYTSDTILPFGNSRLYYSPVTNAKLLTRGDDVKVAFKLCLNIKVIRRIIKVNEN